MLSRSSPTTAFVLAAIVAAAACARHTAATPSGPVYRIAISGTS